MKVHSQPFAYSRCLDCGLLFASERPRAQEMALFYPDSYPPYAPGTEPRAAGRLRAGLISRWARRGLSRLLPVDPMAKLKPFYAPAKPGQRLLDFGCASDGFLNAARESGWATIGMDISEIVLDRVRRSGHQAVLLSPDGWDAIEDGSLDFVRMNHVLEHLTDPRRTLQELRGKMRPHALIHVALPNPVGISAALFRTYWIGLDAPRHLHLYSPRLLERLMAETGFGVTSVAFESSTKDFTRSLGILLRDRRWACGPRVDDLASAQRDWPALIPFFRLAGLVGRSDRYHVVGHAV